MLHLNIKQFDKYMDHIQLLQMNTRAVFLEVGSRFERD